METNSVESTTPLYTLSIASDLSGIPLHSIRQYIDKGLIIPFKKDSNRNLFSQVDILRLKYINRLLTEEGLNVAGIRSLLAVIPCWAIRQCPNDECKTCPAYYNVSYPCWAASEKATCCMNNDCRECDVYRIIEDYPDVKSFIRTLVP